MRVLARPPTMDLVLLGVAVSAISISGPLIVATAAPALAIAFWRSAIGGGLTGLWVAVRNRQELLGLTRRQFWLTVSAGLLLGGHFATWIPSLRLTTVASSTALIATQPIFAALIARARGIRIPVRAWIGIGVAVAGVVLLTGIDAGISTQALLGDLLSLIGAFLAAAYVSVAERVRQQVSTATTTFVLYGSSALLLLVMALAFRDPLTGFSAQAWAFIVILTLTAQLLGHTLFSRVLATTSATIVSMVILLEAPLSTIIAAIFLGQVPPVTLIPAALLLFAGLVLVIGSTTKATPTETSPI
ncbi:MAG: DMT family transporter [Actinomycetales bacterium]